MKDDKIIITKTPLRISFVGGGTDMPYFYNRYNGATISLAINRYIYVTVKYHNNYQEKYRLNYSKTENTNKISNIKNLRIKNVIKLLKIKKPLYINTFADIPTNSGLGSSSAFTVGLILALSKLKKKNLTKKQLAEMAYKIESKITNNSLGKQDHYICAFGGFKHIRYKKSKVNFTSININKNNLKDFKKSIFLVWTGKNRFATNVLKDQKKNYLKNISNLIKMNMFTQLFKREIYKSKISVQNLSNIISDTWELKKNFSNLITNKEIDKLFENLKTKGAYGGKLLGAGNGGFLLTFVPLEKKNKLLKTLKRYKYLDIEVDNNGSEIL